MKELYVVTPSEFEKVLESNSTYRKWFEVKCEKKAERLRDQLEQWRQDHSAWAEMCPINTLIWELAERARVHLKLEHKRFRECVIIALSFEDPPYDKVAYLLDWMDKKFS
jgi:hypothetical protein